MNRYHFVCGWVLWMFCGVFSASVFPAQIGEQPKVRFTLESEPGTVLSLAFSPDGKKLATGSQDGTTELWDLISGKKLAVFRPKVEKAYGVWSVAFSPDGKALAYGAAGHVNLWDIGTGQLLRQFPLVAGDIHGVAFSPDGKFLAGARVSDLALWDVSNGKEIWTTNTLQSTVSSIAFSPDAKMLASADLIDAPKQKNIKLWEVSSGKHIATIPDAQKFGVNCIVFSPDGRTIASGGGDRKGSGPAKNPPVPPPDSKNHDGTVNLWDVATLKNTATFKGHLKQVNSVAFSPDGKILASASFDKTVKLWDIATAQCVATLEEHTGTVRCVAFSPDGKMLASGSGDKSIKLWNIPMTAEKKTKP